MDPFGLLNGTNTNSTGNISLSGSLENKLAQQLGQVSQKVGDQEFLFRRNQLGFGSQGPHQDGAENKIVHAIRLPNMQITGDSTRNLNQSPAE